MHRWMLFGLLALSVLAAGCEPQAGAPSLPSTTASPGLIEITGTVTAGPVCPVETEPPRSGCEDRPVASAVIVVLATGGNEVSRVTSAAGGAFRLALPPGRYRLLPQPVDGLLGTAPEQVLVVGASPSRLTITYDTGIR